MAKERIKALNAEIQTLTVQAKELYSEMDKKSESGKKHYEGQGADKEKLEKILADGETKRAEIETLRRLDSLSDDALEPDKDSKSDLAPAANGRPKSLGTQLVEHKSLPDWAKAGGIPQGAFEIEQKDLSELTSGAGGALVYSDRDDQVRLKPQRPLTILDVITTIPTSSNAVEIIRQTSITNAAAFTAEKSAKPQSNMAFDRQTIAIKTLANWIPVTRQLIEDAPRLRTMVDTQLLYNLELVLETQIISGDGTGENLTGLLNVTGTLARVHQTASNGMGAAGDNVLDTIRFAVADHTLAFFRSDVILISPTLAAKLETAKDAQGRYLERFDPVTQRIWRLRTIEVGGGLLAGTTALVLDTRMSAELYDRRTRAVYTGWINDMFVKNQFALLAEGRYGLGVPYPEGINEVTGLA